MKTFFFKFRHVGSDYEWVKYLFQYQFLSNFHAIIYLPDVYVQFFKVLKKFFLFAIFVDINFIFFSFHFCLYRVVTFTTNNTFDYLRDQNDLQFIFILFFKKIFFFYKKLEKHLISLGVS